MIPRTHYQIHQHDLANGYDPYPFAYLLNGAPLFTWRGWFAKLFSTKATKATKAPKPPKRRRDDK